MTFPLDHMVFRFVNHTLANPVLDVVCPVLRNKNTWVPVYAVIIIYLFYKFRLRSLWIVGFAALTIVCSDQGCNVIKRYTHRLRPCHVQPDVRLVIERCSDTYSFPSSHATNHYALSMFLALIFFRRRRVLFSLIMLWAGSIAFSQVYVGIHYPSDVAAGALIGALLGALMFQVFEKVRKRLDRDFDFSEGRT